MRQLLHTERGTDGPADIDAGAVGGHRCIQIRFRNELWNDCLPGGRDDGRARLY